MPGLSAPDRFGIVARIRAVPASALPSGKYCPSVAVAISAPSCVSTVTRIPDRIVARSRGKMLNTRSEERRVGKECVSTFRSRWSPDNEKKKNNQTHTQRKYIDKEKSK